MTPALIAQRSDRMRTVLFGLSDDLALELSTPLSKFCRNIRLVKSGESFSGPGPGPDIIFCCADTAVVAQLRKTNPTAQIVVVSRLPEVSDWLDAIEAGASDYCAAPFETVHVQWILETSLRAAQTAAAAA